MTSVYIARDPLDAHALREILESNAISAVVHGEHLFPLQGRVPMAYPTVCVNESDIPRAQSIIGDFKKSQTSSPATESWVCQKCGEQNEAQFTACWKCLAGNTAL